MEPQFHQLQDTSETLNASSGQEQATHYGLAENALTSTNDPRPCTISMEGENAMNDFGGFSSPLTALELA